MVSAAVGKKKLWKPSLLSQRWSRSFIVLFMARGLFDFPKVQGTLFLWLLSGPSLLSSLYSRKFVKCEHHGFYDMFHLRWHFGEVLTRGMARSFWTFTLCSSPPPAPGILRKSDCGSWNSSEFCLTFFTILSGFPPHCLLEKGSLYQFSLRNIMVGDLS